MKIAKIIKDKRQTAKRERGLKKLYKGKLSPLSD